MDRRREMARRLGRVFVAVVIVGLVGVMEGSGAEGKDDVEVKIGSGKTLGEKVLAWAPIVLSAVIGGAMWRLARAQKEMARRDRRLRVAEKREAVLRALVTYWEKVGSREGLRGVDSLRLMGETAGKMNVLNTRARELVAEFGGKARKADELIEKIRRPMLGSREREDLEKKFKEVSSWMGKTVQELAVACWEEEKGS